MGMNVQLDEGSTTGEEGGDGGAESVVAEINITPLTDVFLVLLIIFMVTSTALVESEAASRAGVKVVLPKARTLTYHSLYQSVLGTKILLALILFGIAFPLLSSPPAFGNMEEGRRRWVTVLMVLGLVILLFSSVLRRLWDFR